MTPAANPLAVKADSRTAPSAVSDQYASMAQLQVIGRLAGVPVPDDVTSEETYMAKDVASDLNIILPTLHSGSPCMPPSGKLT